MFEKMLPKVLGLDAVVLHENLYEVVLLIHSLSGAIRSVDAI